MAGMFIFTRHFESLGLVIQIEESILCLDREDGIHLLIHSSRFSNGLTNLVLVDFSLFC
jgi:hypothetical protein